MTLYAFACMAVGMMLLNVKVACWIDWVSATVDTLFWQLFRQQDRMSLNAIQIYLQGSRISRQ